MIIINKRGITLFDTAEAYGPFINEELAGEAIKPFRQKVILTTKFGMIAGADTIRRAHKVQPVMAVQNQYAIWPREPEHSVIPTCEELAIGFVPWGPLGTGFLAGKISAGDTFDPKTDLRASFLRFTKENLKANMPLVSMLNGMAECKGVSTVQIGLAWLLAQKPFIVPIPGMDKVEYIEDNIKSVDLELSADDLKEIDDILSKVEIKGERLSQALLDDINEKID